MPVRDTTPAPGEIRQRAHEILGRAEFSRHDSLVQRVVNWIGDQLSRFTFGIGGGPGILGDLISLIVFAAVVVLVVVLVRHLLRRPRIDRPDVSDDLTIELEDGRSASDWAADAERFEASGEWREAMRARYRELVGSLIEDGVLADIPGRTTGEYRGEFAAARPDADHTFRELTDLFEAVWYGGADTNAADNRRFRELAAAARDRRLVGV